MPARLKRIVARTWKEFTMHRKSISRISAVAIPIMIVGGLLAAAASSRGRTARADGPDTIACTNKTLQGDYGSASEGVLLNIPGLPPEAQFRGLTMSHFDGKGNLTWVEHTVINGTALEPGWTPASGTYTVNPDCTGTAVVTTPNSPVPLHLAMVVVNKGKEIHTVLDSDAISTAFIKVE
jgi:hypothetical protein